MRTPSNDLHRLIHSLSGEEVRSFRKFAKRNNKGGKNNALQLFQAILGQEEYEEDKIKEKFKGDAIGKNLPSEKNYLLKLIFKSMRVRQEDKGVDEILRQMLADLHFLMGKDLRDLFQKTLQKARKLAQENDRFTVLLQLAYMERLVVKKQSVKDTKQELEALHLHVKDLMEEMKEFWAYAELHDLMYLSLRRDTNTRDKQTRESISALSSHPLLYREAPPVSFQARMYFYSFKGILAQFEGDFEEVARIRRRALDDWEMAPQMIKNHPGQYIQALSNYLEICHRTGNWEEFPIMIDRIRGVKVGTRTEKVTQINVALLHETTYSFGTMAFDRALNLQPVLERELEEIAPFLPKGRYFAHLYNLAVLNLLYSLWEKASRWLHKIYQEIPSNHRVDIQYAAHILLIISHHELGDVDYLESLFRAYKRFLTQHQGVGPFDKVMKTFLRKLIKHGPGTLSKDKVRELHETLSEIFADKSGPQALGLEEVMYWCESKLEGCMIIDVLSRQK